jgi:hypothetical protein
MTEAEISRQIVTRAPEAVILADRDGHIRRVGEALDCRAGDIRHVTQEATRHDGVRCAADA